MKIALPVTNGKLAAHFGHCEAFDLIDADLKQKTTGTVHHLPAPPHAPGLLPGWLAENGAELIIAGGMGTRAQNLFEEQGIRVITGAPAEAPSEIVKQYLAGNLQVGENICGH